MPCSRPTAANAVAPIVHGIGQSREDVGRHLQPVGGGVHLLFGKIQLTGADVLVGVELDLLEPDDARDDVDFAVVRNRAAYAARVAARLTREPLLAVGLVRFPATAPRLNSRVINAARAAAGFFP